MTAFYHLILLCLVAGHPPAPEPPPLTADEDAAFNVIVGFIRDMPVFAGAESETGALDHMPAVMEHFQEGQYGRHAYDLFDGEAGVLKEIQDYLFEDIILEYENKLLIEYDEKGVVVDEVRDAQGNAYLSFTLDKTIVYQKQKKKVRNTILMKNVNGRYRIDVVYLPEEREKTDLGGLAEKALTSGDFVRAEALFLRALEEKPLSPELDARLQLCKAINQANALYDQGEYAAALEQYEQAFRAEKLPFLQSQISLCTQHVNQSQAALIAALDQANLTFEQEQFAAAEPLYAEVLRLDPSNQLAALRGSACRQIREADRLFSSNSFALAMSAYKGIGNYEQIAYAQRRVRECEAGLQFERHKKLGDHYYEKQDLENAKAAYDRALTFRSDAALSGRVSQMTGAMIQQANRRIEQEIGAAIARVSGSRASPREWLESFQTLYKYEGTRRLSTQAYYIMGIALYANYGGLVEKAGLRSQQKQLYISYLTKAFLGGLIDENDVEYQLIKPKDIKRIEDELRKLRR